MHRNKIPNPAAHVELSFMAPDHPVGICNRTFFRCLHSSWGLQASKGVGLGVQQQKVSSLCPAILKDLAHGPTGGCLTNVWAQVWDCLWGVAKAVHLFKKGLLSEHGPVLRV